MNLRFLTPMMLALGLVACTVQVASPPGPPPGAVVAEPPPPYIEEGSVYNGVVVTPPPAIDSYVFIGGDWFYWSPGFRCWVRSHRGAGWSPPAGTHVYHHWREHPMYHHR